MSPDDKILDVLFEMKFVQHFYHKSVFFRNHTHFETCSDCKVFRNNSTHFDTLTIGGGGQLAPLMLEGGRGGLTAP